MLPKTKKNNKKYEQKDKVNVFIGSSSIGVFKLFRGNSDNIVIKIKGGTAKGLNTNTNGEEIIKQLQNIKKRKNIKCLVLHFGEVDLNFSYYFIFC